MNYGTNNNDISVNVQNNKSVRNYTLLEVSMIIDSILFDRLDSIRIPKILYPFNKY